jgi:hypothetical protein
VIGGIIMSELGLLENTASVGLRGVLPGFWDTPHTLQPVMADLDTFSGAAGSTLDGKKFEVTRTYNTALLMFETTDTWSA